jgi:hypothetical protein
MPTVRHFRTIPLALIFLPQRPRRELKTVHLGTFRRRTCETAWTNEKANIKAGADLTGANATSNSLVLPKPKARWSRTPAPSMVGLG